MLQNYVSEHPFPQDFSKPFTATTSATAGQMVPFNLSPSGKAVSAIDASYVSFTAMTGLAGISGFYAAQYYEQVPGFDDMTCTCSVALQLAGLPADACCMAFTTTLDLSSAPPIALSDPSLTWFPLEVFANNSNLSVNASFPVINDRTIASFFGVAIFGTFGTTAKALNGGISLREGNKEFSVFMPNK